MQGKSVRTKTKRGRGRPPRTEAKAAERLEVRVTADELQELSTAADEAGLPVSSWVRDLALRAARRSG